MKSGKETYAEVGGEISDFLNEVVADPDVAFEVESFECGSEIVLERGLGDDVPGKSLGLSNQEGALYM